MDSRSKTRAVTEGVDLVGCAGGLAVAGVVVDEVVDAAPVAFESDCSVRAAP